MSALKHLIELGVLPEAACESHLFDGLGGQFQELFRPFDSQRIDILERRHAVLLLKEIDDMVPAEVKFFCKHVQGEDRKSVV